MTTPLPDMLYRDLSPADVAAEYAAAADSPEDYQKAKWGSRDSMMSRFRLALERIDWRSHGAWLDIGCGVGVFQAVLREARLMPPRAIGLDICPALVRQAAARFPEAPPAFASGDFGDPSVLADERFDLVTMIGVLQQCGRPPAEALAAAARRLTPGGRLFLTTKNLDWDAFRSGRLAPEHSHSWFRGPALATIVTQLGGRVDELGGFDPAAERLCALEDSHVLYLLATFPGSAE